MAASNAEKLEDILSCPICMLKFTNPTMFKCLHFFCGTCTNQLTPITENNEIGYNCPMCRQFSAKDQLKHMYFMEELLEVINNIKKEHEQPQGQIVLDKQIMCEVHPNEVIKCYCRECSKLLCLVCNATTHKHHHADSIEEALNHIAPAIKEDQEKLKNLISANEKILSTAKSNAQTIDEGYAELEGQLRNRYEEQLSKLQEEYGLARDKLTEIKTKQLGEANEQIKEFELSIKGQRSVLQCCTTTLQTAKGVSLLQSLESGLKDSLRNHAKMPPIQEQSSTEIVAKVTRIDNNDNLLGLSFNEATLEDTQELPTADCSFLCSRHIPTTLRSLTNINTHHIKSIKLSLSSSRFAVVGDSVWFPDNKSIQIWSIYDFSKKVVPISKAGKLRSITETHDGVFVVAEKGLFWMDFVCKNKIKVLEGDISDAFVLGETVFVLHNDRSAVLALQKPQESVQYETTHQIDLSKYNYKTYSNANTLLVTKDYIFITEQYGKEIKKLCHSGELVAKNIAEGITKLDDPRLCGVDSEGTILISDQLNQRLLMVTSEGEWSELKNVGLNEQIRWVVMTANKLFYIEGFFSRTFHAMKFD